VIVNELERLGLTEDTLVMFTSDNGSRAGSEGGSNAPLRGGKGTTWEGGQRLPFIAKWPARIPAGAECGELVTSMDILPTCAAFAGAAPPDDRIIDGRDIAPLLTGDEGAASPHEAFYYYYKNDLDAVRSGRWKLHVSKQGTSVTELYDLEADIGEKDNVYDEHPDVVEALTILAERAREDLGDARTGHEGANCRPQGRISNPKPLTEYDEAHPYIVAMYDVPYAG